MPAFLQQKFAGLPVWAWGLIVGGGGIALFLFIKHQQNNGQQTGQPSAQPNDPNIDPNTGVPYDIESQIDPNTGLPAYYSNFDNHGHATFPPSPPGAEPPEQGPPQPTGAPPFPAPAPTPPATMPGQNGPTGIATFPPGPPGPQPPIRPGPPGPQPPVRPPAPTPKPPRTYTVKAGDTLWKIGQANGVGAATIGGLNNDILISTARAHGVTNPTAQSKWGKYPTAWDHIYPGETLKLPDAPTGSGADFGVFQGFDPTQATPYWPRMLDVESLQT